MRHWTKEGVDTLSFETFQSRLDSNLTYLKKLLLRAEEWTGWPFKVSPRQTIPWSCSRISSGALLHWFTIYLWCPLLQFSSGSHIHSSFHFLPAVCLAFFFCPWTIFLRECSVCSSLVGGAHGRVVEAGYKVPSSPQQYVIPWSSTDLFLWSLTRILREMAVTSKWNKNCQCRVFLVARQTSCAPIGVWISNSNGVILVWYK